MFFMLRNWFWSDELGEMSLWFEVCKALPVKCKLERCDQLEEMFFFGC
jgi:hypothetical protein